ncbi:deoxycytidyl transferase [Allomyces arbusculus]|nr:deoxycytidyl transferase [Allomyces arbusculus]
MSSHQARLSDFWTVSKSDAAVNEAPTSSKPASTRGGPRPPGGGMLLCPPLHFSAVANHVYQAIGGGHQVNESGNRHQTDYWAARQAKLDEQIKAHREWVENATAETAGDAEEGGSAARRARIKIFAGLVFSIDGYTGPDVGDLKLRRLIVEHGGHLRFHFAVSRTTHVIATSLAGSKMHQALTTRRTSSRSAVNRACVFVTPTWVLDSIAAGRRLPEANYLVVRDQTLGRATSARRSAARAGEDVVDTLTALPGRDSVARHASLRLSENKEG